MPVDDRSRLELHRRLEEVLGAHEAEILMDQFPDISARFERVDARFDQVDARLDQVDARLDRLDDRMAPLEKHFSVFSQSFDAKLEGLFARQGWRLLAMMIALAGVLLAGIGVLG
jgi:hypothetical protein